MTQFCSVQGSYNSYECGLEITAAQAEDVGDWACEVESYVKNGQRGDGEIAKVTVLSVDPVVQVLASDTFNIIRFIQRSLYTFLP